MVDGGGTTVDAGGATIDAGGAMGDGGPVSFSSDVAPILATCTVCHYAGGYGGLNLSPSVAYSNTVGVRSTEGCGYRVVKGNASESYLYRKITGKNICYGARMPIGAQLRASQIKTIGDWINEGAPNN